MQRKFTFAAGEYYHVYNRGNGAQKIFLSEGDYFRFLALLYACNGTRVIHVSNIQFEKNLSLMKRVQKEDRGEALVDIGAYCLMPNHFHLLVKAKSDDGVSAFMKKLGTAYVMHFNKKYQKTGRLFENTFKANHVNYDEYLRHMMVYIHANPIDLVQQKWKEDGIQNIQAVNDFLERYQWSSYRYYAERIHNNILHADAFPQYFKNKNEFQSFFNDWIANHEYQKDYHALSLVKG